MSDLAWESSFGREDVDEWDWRYVPVRTAEQAQRIFVKGDGLTNVECSGHPCRCKDPY